MLLLQETSGGSSKTAAVSWRRATAKVGAQQRKRWRQEGEKIIKLWIGIDWQTYLISCKIGG
jgi:hypothetical protein